MRDLLSKEVDVTLEDDASDYLWTLHLHIHMNTCIHMYVHMHKKTECLDELAFY